MIRVLEDSVAMAGAAADLIADTLQTAVRAHGRCTVALAGGGTPAPTYRMLARRYPRELPWDRVHLFWGDERMVPPDHPESNQRMVRRELIDAIDIPEENIHPVTTDLGSPEQAAEHYHHELRLFFALKNRQHPRFDLVLLGLGEDGHTASLFPGCAALAERTSLAASCRSGQGIPDRVTLTLPVLNAAGAVVFLVSGRRKAEILRRVLERDQSSDLPAAMVAPGAGELWWLADRNAASRLPADLLEGER